MATYRILYWEDIPSQIRAEDESGDVSVSMPQRFIARIDAVAMARGLAGSDEYLARWHWSEELERDGSAEEVANAVIRELEAQANG